MQMKILTYKFVSQNLRSAQVDISLCHSERNEEERRISPIPILAKVFPIRICCFYELDLFLAQPSLYSLFSGNGRINITKRLKVNQLVDVVFLGKTLNQLILMLKNSFFDIVGQPGVKRAGFIGHNVNIVLIVFLHIFYCIVNYIRKPNVSRSLSSSEAKGST